MALPQPIPLPISDHAKALAEAAKGRAGAAGRDNPTKLDWLIAVLREEELTVAGILICQLRTEVPALIAAAEASEASGVAAGIESGPTRRFMLEEVMRVAQELRHGYIGPEHVLFTLSRDPGTAGHLLRSAHVTWDRILAAYNSIEWQARSSG